MKKSVKKLVVNKIKLPDNTILESLNTIPVSHTTAEGVTFTLRGGLLFSKVDIHIPEDLEEASTDYEDLCLHTDEHFAIIRNHLKIGDYLPDQKELKEYILLKDLTNLQLLDRITTRFATFLIDERLTPFLEKEVNFRKNKLTK